MSGTSRQDYHGRKRSTRRFCWWLFAVLNLRPDDSFTDLFPGTGIVGKEWERFKRFERQKPERRLFADLA